MTDLLSPHLTDDLLNEYLDGVLAPAAHRAAAAHLAQCPDCSARLASVSAVFSGLAELPPAPLRRDLRAGVMAAVRARPAAAIHPVVDLQRRPVQAAFGLQLLAALALLAFAWPFVANLAGLEQYLAPGWWGGFTSSLGGAGMAASGQFPVILGWLAGLIAPPSLPVSAMLTPAAAGLTLAIAGLLWLLSNAVLLRAPTPPSRRRPI